MEMDEISKIKRRKCRYCPCGKNKVVIGVLIPLGILFAVTAVFFPKIFTDSVKKQLVLTKGSEAYKNWQDPPSPLYIRYHVFNYTNVNDIIEDNAKPTVSQLGPFVYREVRVNKVLDYNEHNITYLLNYSYIFEPSMSCSTCKESNMVYSPRIAALTAIKALHDKLKDPPEYIKLIVEVLMRVESPTLFKKLTVHQVIWGYEDTLLKDLKTVVDFLKGYGVKLPDVSTTIALQRNSTDGANDVGNVTLLTGKDNINDVQKIVLWRGLDYAPYWLTKYGRMINGTDGTHAPPFLKRDYIWYVFITQLCRSLYFAYQKDVTFEKIDMYRFTTTAELFINSSVNPDNAAFCSNNKTCWGSGLLPISKCLSGGPPIFMSSPHFYQGDPSLVERINGLKPNETLHATTVDVEPITGLTMRAHKRLQINVMAQKSWLRISEPLQHDINFFPMLMIEESAVIDSATAKKFRKKVLLPKAVLGYGRYVFLGLGSIMVLTALVIAIMMTSNYYKSSYNAETFKIERITSTVSEDGNISIRKIDSDVMIISNEFVGK